MHINTYILKGGAHDRSRSLQQVEHTNIKTGRIPYDVEKRKREKSSKKQPTKPKGKRRKRRK